MVKYNKKGQKSGFRHHVSPISNCIKPLSQDLYTKNIRGGGVKLSRTKQRLTPLNHRFHGIDLQAYFNVISDY